MLSNFNNDDDIKANLGDIIELCINISSHDETSFNEHLNYDVDYNEKAITMKPSMRSKIDRCELLFSYNPLWIRDLTSNDLPLKMDLWTETFMSDDYFDSETGKVVYTTKVAPRDNLREVVLFDEEDTLTRKILEEDVDFVVDYQSNKITFNKHIDEDTPITIRYTPNLTDTSLSIAYRLDREDDVSQAYVYGNHFTTRT